MASLETESLNGHPNSSPNHQRPIEEKSERDKRIDEWLPITSKRNAKWWYSAFHNVTAMVGAGVLGLPHAMAQLGWGPGVTILILSWIITLYTLWQMVEMHEMVPGKRFDRYHELGQHAFGKKLGLYIVVPQQLVVEIGVNIVYMVTGGTSLQKFHDIVCPSCKKIKLTYFIMIFASVHFVLSHLPDFNSISGVSLAAAVMSFSYSTISWAASIDKGKQDNVEYGYKAHSTAGTVFEFFNALGTIAFAYAGHNVVLEIQATIPSSPEKPSKVPMWRGVVVAYIVVALCYFPVALIGYWIFGNEVDGDILISLEKPAWLIAMANMFVVIHVIGSYQIEGKSELEKQKEDELPSNSGRNAKWWYSTFHNVTAMVGAGVLGLPFAMAALGWGPGLAILVLSWIITLYTLWQMVEMHEMVPGKRLDTYNELGQHAFGEKLGLWIVMPQQLVVQIGSNIVYMVTGGASLQKFHNTVCPSCKPIKLSFFIMIFASAHFVLSHLPNLNSITGVSLVAAVMSMSYSIIAWAGSIHKGVLENVQYSSKATTTAGSVFNFFNALGSVAFAFAGHNVVLEIQATIPSTPEKPSKGPMWRGVIVAYIIVALCYFPVSIIGYWVFGNEVKDNILVSLENPAWLIAMANFFVVIHVIGSYQVFAMPVFDMIENKWLVEKLNFKPSKMLRFVVRNVYVALTMFIAITFPFFGGLLGFFGGFAFAPTTYFLPCIMWLKLYNPKRFSLSWWINWICIVLGVCIMILAPIGALRSIILDAKTYKFYS